jgi:hypothetical protein
MRKDNGAKAPSPNARRQSELKDRRRADGLVRFERWVTPEHKIKLIEHAKTLENEVQNGN